EQWLCPRPSQKRALDSPELELQAVLCLRVDALSHLSSPTWLALVCPAVEILSEYTRFKIHEELSKL
ncbi:mCG146217, partial [Mus musculus]